MKAATKERLAEVAERATAGEKPTSLYSALLSVQAAMPRISRSATAGGSGAYSYDYAPLEAILDAIRPVLTANGLRLGYGHEVEGGLFWTYARVTHAESDQSAVASFPIPMPSGGGNVAQDMGKLATYGRRYATLSLLAIAPEDEDDDAAGIKGRQPEAAPTGQDPRRSAPKPKPAPPAAKADLPPSGVIHGAVLEVRRGLWRGTTKHGPSELCRVVIETEDGATHELTNFVPRYEATFAEAESFVGTPQQVAVLYSTNSKGKWSIDGIKSVEFDTEAPSDDVLF